MYRSIEDFKKDWKYESESTVKLINALTDESLNQKVTSDGRSLGFIAWHIVKTIPEMLDHTGLKIEGPADSYPVPEKAVDITDAYEKTSASFIKAIEDNWNDDMLQNEDDMYGEKWKKGLTLMYLNLHQAHHRGQMTVLMRQAGLKVPGVYGPSKEEWTAYGMEPME